MATPANETDLLDYAINATASQVEDYSRQMRNVQRKVSTRDANTVHKARHLQCASHDDGSLNINIELPRETGELVMKAIEMAMTASDAETNDIQEQDLQARDRPYHGLS